LLGDFTERKHGCDGNVEHAGTSPSGGIELQTGQPSTLAQGILLIPALEIYITRSLKPRDQSERGLSH
jgi:hypothetical protein